MNQLLEVENKSYNLKQLINFLACARNNSKASCEIIPCNKTTVHIDLKGMSFIIFFN